MPRPHPIGRAGGEADEAVNVGEGAPPSDGEEGGRSNLTPPVLSGEVPLILEGKRNESLPVLLLLLIVLVNDLLLSGIPNFVGEQEEDSCSFPPTTMPDFLLESGGERGRWEEGTNAGECGRSLQGAAPLELTLDGSCCPSL